MSSDTPSGTRAALGWASLVVPAGWTEVNRTDDRLTFRRASPPTRFAGLLRRQFPGPSKPSKGGEQATITRLELAAKPSLEEFQRICNHRLDAERTVLKDGFVKDSGAANAGTKLMFLFHGGDKAIGRIFSGCLMTAGSTVFTVYLEGFAVEPRALLESFNLFVSLISSQT